MEDAFNFWVINKRAYIKLHWLVHRKQPVSTMSCNPRLLSSAFFFLYLLKLRKKIINSKRQFTRQIRKRKCCEVTVESVVCSSHSGQTLVIPDVHHAQPYISVSPLFVTSMALPQDFAMATASVNARTAFPP